MNSESRQSNSFLLPLSILVVGVLIAGAIYLNRTSVEPQKISITAPSSSKVKIEAFIPITNKDHILGDAEKAKVVIVDYSDLECPYCKELHETFLKIVKDYESTGEVAWVHRHFPLSIHTKAIKEAEASECVAELGGNAAFWEFMHTVFANTPSNDGLDPKNLSVFAKKVGVDVTKFDTCLSTGTYATEIKEDYENAIKLIGTESTPFTVLVVGGQVVPLADKDGTGFGALPYPTMKALIDEFVNGAK
jgi:protein-disulfide isomerase